ncbi:MAG: MFS transporter, partial [Candidatus Brockarchaeota archaeon]|nr:MFS transporter [Candidatus Brockarchaeota archaeon]
MFLLGFLTWSSLAPLYLYYGWYLRSEGIDYVEIGMVLGSSVIFTFFAQLLSGSLFDRFHNYKYLLLITFLIRSLSTSFIVYLSNPRDTYIWYVLSSFSLGMFSPLSQSIIAETSRGE